EEQFSRTLERGMTILNDELSALSGDVVPGALVFKLYDTYGFPADLTNDVARERGLRIDEEGFNAAMAEQRKRAQQASQFDTDYNEQLKSDNISKFDGYELSSTRSTVLEILVGGESVSTLQEGQTAYVILDQTPFYAESGGQIGDTGTLQSAKGSFVVSDTIKIGQAIAHKGSVQGGLAVGEHVEAQYNVKRREAVKLNHSATHLMHAALKTVLGTHVNQKGSLVTEERLRFDFSHFEGMTKEQISQVEALVNEQIRANHALQTKLMNLDEAKAAGA
ncbi:MAG: alanine--tRNA ligase-related protein, partial [Paraglaciecola sp.]|nr:alanine--tRNA ligase-related protein [Paraglaciecola sp.]